MNELLLVPKSRLAELNKLNESQEFKGICAFPVELEDGNFVLPKNLLSDNVWSEYFSFLNSLTTLTETPIFKRTE